MATVEVISGQLTITLEGAHKFWALKGSLTFPVANIASIRHEPNAFAVRPPWYVWRVGTNLPRRFYAGTFWYNGMKNFWDVGDFNKVLLIELKNDAYKQVYIQVGDPVMTAELLQRSIAIAQRV